MFTTNGANKPSVSHNSKMATAVAMTLFF